MMSIKNWSVAVSVSFRWVALVLSILLVETCLAIEPKPEVARADQEFLEALAPQTFNFFWETANADTGLVPDRWPSESPASIAAVGFGLTAYCIGVERGLVSRDQAIERVQKTLDFFWRAKEGGGPKGVTHHHGFYYHFIDMQNGNRQWECELSSIDTALLMLGVLSCREYFDEDDPREAKIRDRADALYRRVEWDWMQPRKPLICMSWRPEHGFSAHDYRGYNEAMFLYVLAMGSPTHAIDESAWGAYTSTYRWADFEGYEQVNFGPLFGHQYSHAWIDFRKIQDPYMREKGIDYFENSRRATYSQRKYAIKNPQGWRGYGADMWGLTACDGPADIRTDFDGEERQFHSYWARGASADYVNDDGTIAPTAAGGSIPFAPEITISALRKMRARYGDFLVRKYGFLDSFNPSFHDDQAELKHGKVFPQVGWVADDYLGIDQGPIILMIENHRSNFVWDLMKKSPYLRRGLRQAGFAGGWLEEE